MSTYNEKLHDDQWQLLQLIIASKHSPGTPGKDDRLFIEAVMFIVPNRFRWRELPAEFGKWAVIYLRFKRWTLSGTWRRLSRGTQSDMTLHSKMKEIEDFGEVFLCKRKERQDRKMLRLKEIKK